MTRIDFYLLAEDAIAARDIYACRIIEKAYQQQHQVFIQVATAETAQQFDALLWTFRDISFIPHQIYPAETEDTCPILISTLPPPDYQTDILVNLTSHIPEMYQRFNRVIEIIPNLTQHRTAARNTYRLYREAGCRINLHDLSKGSK